MLSEAFLVLLDSQFAFLEIGLYSREHSLHFPEHPQFLGFQKPKIIGLCKRLYLPARHSFVLASSTNFVQITSRI